MGGSDSNKGGDVSEQMTVEAQHVLDNIRARRTFPWQRLADTPVRDADLMAVLEAANWAPSHQHTEPWRFWVFREYGRSLLADLLAQTYIDSSGSAFKEPKLEKTRKRAMVTPVTIAIVYSPSTDPVMPEVEELMAIGGAVQNLHLAAHSLGMGGSFSTPGYANHENIRAYFGLATHEQCLGFFYLGYRAGENPTSKRGDLSAKLKVIEG